MFAESRPDPAFQITAVQWNQLFPVFCDAAVTPTELKNAHFERIKARFSSLDPGQVDLLAGRGHVAAIAASLLASQVSASDSVSNSGRSGIGNAGGTTPDSQALALAGRVLRLSRGRSSGGCGCSGRGDGSSSADA